MEKEWCTYGYESERLPAAVGKIVRDGIKYVDILYSENQLYLPTTWDASYVVRFDVLEEALDYFWKNKAPVDTRIDREWTLEKYKSHLEYSFPSYFKQKKN